jgi:DNA (cytosine-5)-methyltransferase 1
VAAWRVLDLQHFGPPQRRVRVFVLAARAGGVDPAEVLALNEGVCRHPSPRSQARKIAAASTGGGVEGGCLTPWDSESKRVFTDAAVFPTLYAAQNSGQQQQSVMALNISNGVPSLDDTMGTLDTDGASTTAIGNQTRGVVLSFAENQKGETRLADVTQALAGGGGKPGQGYAAVLCTTGDITHALTHEGADASEDGTGRGTPIVARMVAYGEYTEDGTGMVVGTLDCSDGIKWGSNQWVAQGKAMVTSGRPRRLTPKECERLMSWPDQWTATGRKDDGTEYALTDTARYRLCGNGVGSVCAEWIGRRLVEAVTAQGDA